MKLLWVRGKNIGSLGNFEIDLADRGVLLVSGYSEDEGSSNGSGKSTLATKAPLWIAFGETPGGLKADAIANRHAKKGCEGQMGFIAEDGEEYWIDRRRPAKLSLYKGDDDISGTTAKQTQEMINKLLGTDFKTFIQTSFFGQGRAAHYASLPPKDQKAVLEQILPMAEVDAWAAYADKEAKKLKPQLEEMNLNLRGALSEVQTLRGQLHSCEEDGIQFEQQREVRIVGARERAASVEESFKPSWEALGDRPDQPVGGDIEKLIADDERSLAVVKILQQENAVVLERCRESGNAWDNTIHRLQELEKELQTESACPTCGRLYDESTQQSVGDRLRSCQSKLADAKKTHEQATEAWLYYDGMRKRYDEVIQTHNDTLDRLRARLSATASWDQARTVLVAKVEAATAAAQAALAEAENATNPHVTTAQRLTLEIAAAEERTETLKEEHDRLTEEYGHLVHWREVYGKEMKLKLFEDACPFLEERTGQHLRQLKNGQLHCTFSTVKRLATGEAKEEFNVECWSETGGRGFASLSGGEQQMVSFAIGLALADLAKRVSGSHSGLLILDEPLTELDARNCEAVVDYLTAEIEQGRDTVLMISNEEALKGLIQNRIHVEKSDGVSRVIEENN